MRTLDAAGVCQLVGHLFSKQQPMLSLWQTLADNFYPERSDFRHTYARGQELADFTVDSFPILARRDLGNSFHAMLRDGQWFELTSGGDYKCDREGKAWLEWATHRQFRVMHDRAAMFDRSVKQGDHDYATFGNTVISIEPNKKYNGILYRNWHIRDCAWEEGASGQVEVVARKWNPTLRTLVDTFGEDKIPQQLKAKLEKSPFETVCVNHLVVPAEMSHNDKWIGRFKYVSYFVLDKSKEILEEKGLNYKYYVVPRFQTVAGSAYAYSPATVVALPDARTLQAMTYTLLEAAERYARPPIVATQKVIQGVVNLRPNGITWVDNEYDERLGTAIRALPQDKGGYPIGSAERGRVYEILSKAFYLDSLTMPLDTGNEMTAYEVQERMKQYRRTNLPLFAPLEKEYNGQICEATFDLLMMMGAFGSPNDIPGSLQGNEVEFKYKSPLTADEEEKKVQQFQQTSEAIATAAQLDAGAIDNIDFDEAVRDALHKGAGIPISWLRRMDDIEEIRGLRLQQQAMAQQAMADGEAGAAA